MHRGGLRKFVGPFTCGYINMYRTYIQITYIQIICTYKDTRTWKIANTHLVSRTHTSSACIFSSHTRFACHMCTYTSKHIHTAHEKLACTHLVCFYPASNFLKFVFQIARVQCKSLDGRVARGDNLQTHTRVCLGTHACGQVRKHTHVGNIQPASCAREWCMCRVTGTCLNDDDDDDDGDGDGDDSDDDSDGDGGDNDGGGDESAITNLARV